MQVAIVGSQNGIGLQRDFDLLRDYLVRHGHEVTGYQYDETPQELPKYDLAIFLEVIPRAYLGLADTKFWFANAEWLKPDKLEVAQKYIDKVFAKTHEAQRILEPLLPGKVHYTGFLTRDQYEPLTPRELRVLHIGGNSSLRGTQSVLDAWRWRRDGHYLDLPLTIISTAIKEQELPPNVTVYDRVSEEELKRLQNSHFFHLFPSGTEGFGHAIHEAQSVSAFLITTGAPPMCELEAVYIPPSGPKRTYGMADVYDVSALDVYRVMENVKSHYDGHGAGSRDSFLYSNAIFEESFFIHLEEVMSPKINLGYPITERKDSRPVVAFLGNFGASESTENMIKWALTERLGMEVECLQENETNLAAMRNGAFYSDYFLWVRTPGWLRVLDDEMLQFLKDLRTPSLSIHLDKFWGIPEREKLIGVHPFWRTDFVFTADGGFQEQFKERGVNHFWMKPAVSEVYCHPGTPREEYRFDVGFVGAREYHSEYPFRKQMVEFLEKTYGPRFKHIEGVRGHLLNDVYASLKVVVGDCFQAGTPNYWSDRLPETCGRYGFLLHPYVDGIDIPVMRYQPQNLDDLHAAIETMLRDEDRTDMIKTAAVIVRERHTWTARMKEIFAVVDNAKD